MSGSVSGGLSINGLRLEVEATGFDIVDEVNLTVAPGTILGLVGESGSGKCSLTLAVASASRRVRSRVQAPRCCR
jgi:peptide/nickel transport system ATP-binding protein